MELIARNGWWLMRLISDAPEAALNIGVLFRAGFGWGYWDCDVNNNKEWIEITVPENDPTKVKHVPNYYEMGRTMAYIMKDATAESVVDVICANCIGEDARLECLNGFYDSRQFWNLPQITIDESTLLSHR